VGTVKHKEPVGIGAKILLYTMAIFVRNAIEGESVPRQVPKHIMSLLLVIASFVKPTRLPRFGSSILPFMASTYVSLATYKKSNQNSLTLWINRVLPA
jgi:Na+/alanine symporter